MTNTLSPLESEIPSIDAPGPLSVKLAVDATLTESLKSSPTLTASTYSFVTREVVPKPDLSLYPEGTVTVPVPFGERIKSPFEFVVEIVFALALILSTLKFVKPVNAPPVSVAVLSVND